MFKQKPVIFLAFANDRVNDAAYLRNLPRELRGIRMALHPAVKAGLCEVVERANASVEDIFGVFQDEAYRNRIAVFHYGGHANCYKLLLESMTQGQSPAYREGLAEYLARQQGLTFVFLNGCSTEQHAIALTQAGIPMVVGTSQSINDRAATNLSIRFFKGLGRGFSLARAWREAEDYINIRRGTANFRDLYWDGKREIEDRFPWRVFYKDGAEKIKTWNLPTAARCPLFGLPGIPARKLPEVPFLLLGKYTADHAEIFFGAAGYIRGLYDRVTDSNAPPVILLYGQTGVGKSSLLEAGLLPRLEETYTICLTQRQAQTGLLETLQDLLDRHITGKPGNDTTDIAGKWKRIENETGKPLLIVLDQVEEAFSKPNRENPGEAAAFFNALGTAFATPADYPLGKFILSYRKEFHPEIVELLLDQRLDRRTLFMEPLGRENIIEVITGLNSSEKLQNKYHLEVEEQLPVIIADDLLADPTTPVAPVLQVILTRLWKESGQDANSSVRRFTTARYRALQREGLLLRNFFRQQMTALREWCSEVVDSGLALDVLHYHTSNLGTGCPRSNGELREVYRNRTNILDELILNLKAYYLLVDGQSKGETVLTHDTLAPVVIDEYYDSRLPGQRASRILSAKAVEFNKNIDTVFLDAVDLDIVERGKDGMRALDIDETKLLECSRERKAEHDREKKRHRNIRVVLIAFTILFAIFAAFQWRIAAVRRQRSETNRLTAVAQVTVREDPTAALRIAAAAARKDNQKIITETLQRIYRENIFYKIIARLEDDVSCVAISPDGSLILTGSGAEESKAFLWDMHGRRLAIFKGHNYSITSAAFSPDGKYILTGSRDRTARLWDLQGKELRELKGHSDWIYSVAFSSMGDRILTGSRDRTARLWDLRGNQVQQFIGHEADVLCAAFLPGGEYMITSSVDRTARMWRWDGTVVMVFKGHGDWVNSVSFSPAGNYILTGSQDCTARLWDLNGNTLRVFAGHNRAVRSAVFSPEGSLILTASQDQTARIWDVEGNLLHHFKGHEHAVTTAVFAPNGKSVITGSGDKTIRLWRLEGNGFNVLGKQKAAVTALALSPEGQYILSGSMDGSVCLWDRDGEPMTIFQAHSVHVTSAAVSPDDRYILTGSTDNTARLWNWKGERLAVFNGHKDRVSSVAFSPDSRYILTGSWDNTVILRDFRGNVILHFAGHKDDVTSVAFSPDGLLILSGSWDHNALMWNRQGKILREFNIPRGLINTVSFSPDGNYILTGSNEGTGTAVRLWHINGKLLNIIREHRYRISSAVFSPDGQSILTGSWDRIARLWDRDGNLLQEFGGHRQKVTAAVYSPDNQYIYTGSGSGILRRWERRMRLKVFLENGLCQELDEEQKRRYKIQ